MRTSGNSRFELRHAWPKQEKELIRKVWARPALRELVDEIIQLGHMPTHSKNASFEEKRLARRLIYVRNGLRRARKAKKLSPEQEAELEALQQEPRDVRAQGGDTGTAIRRRPAATNAEEDRRLSRRTDAS